MLSFPIAFFIFILSVSFVYLIYIGTTHLLEQYKPMKDSALLGP